MAITINGSGITSSEIADGTITNADINASAGIVGLLGQVAINNNSPVNPRWLKLRNVSDAVSQYLIR